MQQHLLRREYIHCLSHTVPRASGVADGRASLMVRTASRHYSNAFITAIKKFTRGGGGDTDLSRLAPLLTDIDLAVPVLSLKG